jgi:transcriptional regulator with XRE-family HTH domain
MDQIKIGKFIAEARKEQNLTQLDLAEKLGISNKTVSKWECGNGMPDYAVMEGLCEILKINVNELLSGERLPSQEYTKKAEENMMNLIQESSENYKREKREMLFAILGIAVLLLFVILTIVMTGGVSAIGNFIDMPTIIYMTGISVMIIAVAGMLKDFVKAFPLSLKKDIAEDKQQIQRAMLAVKTAIFGVNMSGIVMFMIGLVTLFKVWSGIEDSLDVFLINIAVAMISIVYAFVLTLILIPIYMRLKAKLIEA